MQAHQKWKLLPATLSLTVGLLNVAPVWAENMRLFGEVVMEPCALLPGDENISLDFGTVVEKYLYLNQRTHGKPFQLHLTGCDVQPGSGVTLTFSGTPNVALPGLLALDGGSQASGIAIGMETVAGKMLPFNEVSEVYPLTPGDNVITLQAYVQGEPDALNNQGIRHGNFSAVATFSLAYP
ncbi:Major MR/P fimbria protein precursor [Serratia quinivorans]|jgi:type 1 fimbria pilin|uniref:fimbrial protein n=1 Tax=Serratia quinivorans TaxID=137545 RepID=UPI000D8F360A|nr:fimbrial protein [Serratia quinivorans]CAI1124201.1 Major MR/P fimbria protein precursor [Serratia quinivorans]SPZ65784.1 Major MR/P fimbria protein precursor [Serratia quinivorans]VEI74021.1 Major MR/P fimbria protein precursor [Serratia quinivorans]